MAEVKYTVHEVKGEGLSFNSMKCGKTIGYVVKNGDRKVWSTGMYFENQLVGRSRSAAKARATKAANQFQSYFERTGICWEIEKDAKEGAELFDAEVKALIDLTERKLARDLFQMYRNGETGHKTARAALYTKARETIMDLIVSRRSDGFVTRYRKIDAYRETNMRDLLTEASEPFKVNL